MPTREERPVQKKGRDARKPFIFSMPFLLLLILLTGLVWYVKSESTIRDIPYGGFMQILKAEDPGLRFQNVAVRHKAEVRGDLLVTDIVSTGTLTDDGKPATEQVAEKYSFRTRIGLASDAELLKRLAERVGQS